MGASEVLLNLATTFVGALLAIGLTYFYDKQKDKSIECSDRRKVLNAVRMELTRNLERIEELKRHQWPPPTSAVALTAHGIKSKPDVAYIAVFPEIRFERAALDAATFSGKLFLLDEDTLETVGDCYRRIDLANRNADDFRTIARSPIDQTTYHPVIVNLIGSIRTTVDSLQEVIPEVIQRLDQELQDHKSRSSSAATA